ncbi:MAG: hypothetical protein ABI760_04235 [Ferruginibacter sp.]
MAAVVISFILLGKLLEAKAKDNTSSAIRKIMGMQSKIVKVIHDGGYQMEMPVAAVKAGDHLLVNIDIVRDIKPLVRSYHPPISDIRIAIQLFQI